MRLLRARHIGHSSGRSLAVCSSGVPVSRRRAERPVPPLQSLFMRGFGRMLRKVGKSKSRYDILPPRSYRRPVRPPASGGVLASGGVSGLRRRPDTCQSLPHAFVMPIRSPLHRVHSSSRFPLRGAVLPTERFFVVRVGTDLRMSRELAPVEHLRVAEYCRAAALITFWQLTQLLADGRANGNRGGGPARAATTGPLERRIVTPLIIIGFDLSRMAHHSVRSPLGMRPMEQILALVRGLYCTNRRAGAPMACSAGQESA
jgi:hypothetical protein